MTEFRPTAAKHLAQATEKVFSEMQKGGDFEELKTAFDGFQHEFGSMLTKNGLQEIKDKLDKTSDVKKGNFEVQTSFDPQAGEYSAIQFEDKKSGNRIIVAADGSLAETIKHNPLPKHDELRFWPMK